jgi:hypothetical protein
MSHHWITTDWNTSEQLRLTKTTNAYFLLQNLAQNKVCYPVDSQIMSVGRLRHNFSRLCAGDDRRRFNSPSGTRHRS